MTSFEITNMILLDYHGTAKKIDDPQAEEDALIKSKNALITSKKALIKSLRFGSMNQRYDNVRENAPRTCKWLLETAEWREWKSSFDHDGHRRLLWIKGHAGTGKSTCMKFAAEHAYDDEEAFKDNRIITHFFNARAKDQLDKSAEGMYRTVLVQLLAELSPESVKNASPRQMFTEDHEWSLGTLSNMFKKVIRECEQQSITCFIDALDECNDEQAANMVHTFGDLVEKDNGGTRFRVCFSSRHYPNIVASEGLALDLVLDQQPGHLKDIEAYIDRYLHISGPGFAQFVRQEVKRKANGIFIWCELVVDILNKEWARGRLNQEAALRQKLNALPAGLHDLFETILFSSHEDPHQSSEMLICFQWHMFAYKQYGGHFHSMWWAIQRGTRPDAPDEQLMDDYQSLSAVDQERYIVDVSKGLFQIFKQNDKASGSVQVIHQSVTDFLLKEGGLARLMSLNGVCNASENEDTIRAQSHKKLKEICLAEGFQTNENLEPFAHRPKHQGCKKVGHGNPLRLYAFRVLNHANDSHRDGQSELDQSSFLENFERAGLLPDWRQLYSEGFLGCSTPPDHGPLTLTDALILCNARALLMLHYRQKQAKGLAECKHFGLEPSAAWSKLVQPLRTVSSRFLLTLFEIHLQRHEQNPSRQAALRRLEQDIDWKEVLHHRVEQRSSPIKVIAILSESLAVFFIVALLSPERDAEQLVNIWSTTWSEICGMEKSVGSLLLLILADVSKGEAESMLNLEETLCWATRWGYTSLVQLLFERFGVSPNAEDPFLGSALHHAVAYRHATVVELILSQDGVDPARLDNGGRSPLFWARSLGDEDRVTYYLLLANRVFPSDLELSRMIV